MIQTVRKAWGIPELRKKIIFTIMILLIFRLGNGELKKKLTVSANAFSQSAKEKIEAAGGKAEVL